MHRPPGTRRRTTKATTAILGCLTAIWLTAGASSAVPPGNNGTVKVNGIDLDGGPGNQPHLGCKFEINFYGYDEGAGLFASYSVEGQAPTGGGELRTGTDVPIGEDAAGGGTDLDATVVVDMTGAFTELTPDPTQGFHVKLTVHADGSVGADVKHKTFWVNGEDACSDGGGTT